MFARWLKTWLVAWGVYLTSATRPQRCHLAAHFSHLTHLRAFMKHFAALWQLLLHLLRQRACPTWTQCGNLIMTMCRANKLEKLRYTRSTPLRAVLHYAQ